MFKVKVTCYEGYKAEQTPRKFVLEGREFVVKEIVDQWLSLDHRYFKVLADDGFSYILRNDVIKDIWEITLANGTGGLTR